MAEEVGYKIDFAYPDTIKWHTMTRVEKDRLVNAELIFGDPLPKPIKWGKFLNRWVSSFATQAILPCGRIVRCGLRTGKTFDYLVVGVE